MKKVKKYKAHTLMRCFESILHPPVFCFYSSSSYYPKNLLMMIFCPGIYCQKVGGSMNYHTSPTRLPLLRWQLKTKRCDTSQEKGIKSTDLLNFKQKSIPAPALFWSGATVTTTSSNLCLLHNCFLSVCQSFHWPTDDQIARQEQNRKTGTKLHMKGFNQGCHNIRLSLHD